MRRQGTSQGDWLKGYERTVTLPLGYVDASGRLYREVQLRPMTGREQQQLRLVPETTSVAMLTTEILARCMPTVDESLETHTAFVRDLLIGDREYLLLQLYRMTFGNYLHVLLRCLEEECGEVAEVRLDLTQFTVEASPIQARTFTMSLPSNEELRITCRLLTGEDQEALSSLPGLAEEEQTEFLLRRCILDGAVDIGQLSESDREAIEAQMESLAPGIEVKLEAVCPQCSKEFTYPIDIPFLVLNEMKASEASLDLDIHSLAFYYHWSESEIMELTPRRRARYIELLEDELERIAN